MLFLDWTKLLLSSYVTGEEHLETGLLSWLQKLIQQTITMKVKPRQKIQYTIVNTSYLVLLVALVSLVTVIGVSQFEDNPVVQLLSVNSGSMEPSIKTGGMIMIRQSDMYSIGSVVTYKDINRNVLITHRIIDVQFDESGLFYITKGDANDGPDQQRVRLTDILGRVVMSVPWVGYLVQYAKTQLGFSIIVLIPTFIIVIREINIITVELLQLISSGRIHQLKVEIME